jgi:hypothetical protein
VAAAESGERNTEHAKRKTVNAKRKAGAKPTLPRVPLPRQVGGAHEDKRRRPDRKKKHKGRPGW